LTGAGGISHGSGIVTLSGSNTHTGANSGSPINYAYSSGSAQTVRGTTYTDLTFSGAGTKTIGAATTVNGSFTTGSDINQNGVALVFNGPVSRSSGSITAGGNAVTYSSASNQDVLFGTVTSFTKSGAGVATLTGNLVATATAINGGTLDLLNFNFNATTLSGSGALTAGSGTITLAGNNTHSGTFNSGTSTVIYNVAAAQTFQGYSSTGYYTLTISNNNTKTL
jgi:fibronectin-binding autotransporter adhesin